MLSIAGVKKLIISNSLPNKANIETHLERVHIGPIQWRFTLPMLLSLNCLKWQSGRVYIPLQPPFSSATEGRGNSIRRALETKKVVIPLS